MSRNSNFGGIIAEEKHISGTAAGAGGSSIGSYFQGVASYLPSSIKKQLHISPPPHHNYDDGHDIVLGAEFDRYETASGETHLCLMLSYNNGFQVWDLQHPDGKREIVSVRDPTPIKSIKFLPNPIEKEPPNSLLAGKRPLLAVISAEESTKFPRSHVKFYSLKANDYINLLRFRSPVYTIECNQRTLLVGLRDSIYGFDLVTMERILNVPCYPSPLNNAVMALGPRYAANQTMTPPGVSAISPHGTHVGAAGTTNYVEVAKDVATDLAKEVAQGLFYLGDMGRKTVSNYLYPDDMQPGPNATSSNIQIASSEHKDTEHAGTVSQNKQNGRVTAGGWVRETAKKNILHFRAHSQPLSVLRFDPSGTLLVTSSVDGHNFNVFQIGLSGTGTGAGAGASPVAGVAQELTYRHLYKLVRGVTNATIQDICFSADSKWMAISSTRGTTRGAVNVHTHVPATNRPPDMLNLYKPDIPVPLVTLSVCNRIKTPSAASDEGNPRNVSTIGSTCRFMGISQTDERLLVFSKNGFMTLYQLSPHPPTQAELDPLTLQLAISPMSEADVSRRTKWPEYRQNIKESTEKDTASPAPHVNDMKWLSNVEISTHSPHLRLLWIGCPQFSFRTFQTASSLAPSSSSPPSRSNMPDLLSTSPPPSFFGEHGVSSGPSSKSGISNANTPSMGVLFDENVMIPTKRIDIRRHDPLPFKESLDDLHSTSNSTKNQSRADDFIKESLLDAISTPMVADVKPNKYNNLTKQSTEFMTAQGLPETLRPRPSSPIVVDTLRTTAPANVHTSTSTSSSTSTSTSSLLSFHERPTSLASSSHSDSTSAIPNYYSPYNPSPQNVPTNDPFITSSPTLPPRNPMPASSGLSTLSSTSKPPIVTSTNQSASLSNLSRNTTLTTPLNPPVQSSSSTTRYPASPSTAFSPVVHTTTTTTTTLSSSPSSPAAGSSPSTSSPLLSSAPTTSPMQSIASRVIPISSSSKSSHSPFSTSPPFPESELEKPNTKARQTKKSEGEEDEDVVANKSTSKSKKKKNKGRQRSADREQAEEADFS